MLAAILLGSGVADDNETIKFTKVITHQEN